MRTLYKMLKGTVLYHLPLEDTIVQLKGNLQLYNPGDEGFLIAPFNKEEEQYIILPEEEQIIPLSRLSTEQVLDLHYNEPFQNHCNSLEDYTDYINKGIDTIALGRLKKVVLSRCEWIKLPSKFNVLSYFKDLCITYPDAFTYLISVPVFGTWIGASPEVLLNVQQNIVHTMALAGTRLQNNAEDTSFTEKEFNEQLLVKDYIKEILEKYCADVSLVQGIRQAGKLEHIVTYFKALLKEDFSAIKLAFELHPTPAICGIPTREAMDFILNNEKYDRRLYSGFLGSIKQNNIALFVNLRCMELNQSNALLYAGGGIVNGSDPDKEWKETQNKMKTLKNVLPS